MTNSIRKSSVPEIWQEIQKTHNENPVPYQRVGVVDQYEINGGDAGTYQFLLADGHAEVVGGPPKQAACNLKLSDNNFKEMILGNFKGTTAFIIGKLGFIRTISQTLKLQSILQPYDFKRIKPSSALQGRTFPL